jgi:hypothetical protein
MTTKQIRGQTSRLLGGGTVPNLKTRKSFWFLNFPFLIATRPVLLKPSHQGIARRVIAERVSPTLSLRRREYVFIYPGNQA